MVFNEPLRIGQVLQAFGAPPRRVRSGPQFRVNEVFSAQDSKRNGVHCNDDRAPQRIAQRRSSSKPVSKPDAIL
jgi:hypothetical protein